MSTYHLKIPNQIVCYLAVRLPVPLRAALENVKQPDLADEHIRARFLGLELQIHQQLKCLRRYWHFSNLVVLRFPSQNDLRTSLGDKTDGLSLEIYIRPHQIQ